MGKNQDKGYGINIPDPQHCRGVKSRVTNSWINRLPVTVPTSCIRHGSADQVPDPCQTSRIRISPILAESQPHSTYQRTTRALETTLLVSCTVLLVPGSGGKCLGHTTGSCHSLPVLRIRIRDPVPFWPLDPGSGIGFSGSRISDPKPIFIRAWW